MAKEKKRNVEEKDKNMTMFYYEIIGAIVIILTVTTLGKLGKVGVIFTTIFKVLFGDWYWAIILLILFIGLYLLFIHEKFNYKNTKFISIIFLLITIILLSHFSIHKYIIENEDNYISNTIDIYKSYINTKVASSLGGGIIGAILFYIIYYLLGNIGVIIFSFILFLLAISLFFNLSLIDMFKVFMKGGKNVKNKLSNFNKFFKYEIGTSKTSKKKFINLKELSYIDNELNEKRKEDEVNNRNKLIIEELNNQGIIVSHFNVISSYYVSTYYYDIGNIDLIKIIKYLKYRIGKEILYYYHNNQLVLQITNDNLTFLSLKELIQNNDSIDNRVAFGIDYNNKLILSDINEEPLLLLLGDSNVGINTFIESFIYTLLLRESVDFYHFLVYNNVNDISKSISEKFNFIKQSNDILSFFDEVNKNINERLSILNKNNVINYQELIKKEMNSDDVISLKKGIFIINDLYNEYKNIKLFENKMLYFSQVCKKVGITLIYVVRKENNINSTIYNLFDNKIWFHTSKQICEKISINRNDFINNASVLMNKGDCLYVGKKSKKRMITPITIK